MFPREIEAKIFADADSLSARGVNRERREEKQEEFESIARQRLREKLFLSEVPIIDTGITFYEGAYEDHPELEAYLEYAGKGSSSSYFPPKGIVIYARVEGSMGRFVFIQKEWRSRYKDREGHGAHSHNRDYHVYWEEEEAIPIGFNPVSFSRDDLLYLRSYLTERGFETPFIRSVLHETLDNLWKNLGYEAYFVLSVTCHFLFGFNAEPLDVEYIEDGWDEGNYINGVRVDVDVFGIPSEEVIALLPDADEMTSMLRTWIDEL